MIRSLLLLYFLWLTGLKTFAQVGIGTTMPDPSAQLDIQSSSKGVLIPRVSSTASVTATAEGLLVYQTSSPIGFYVYMAGAWVRLATTGDQPIPAIIPFGSGGEPITLRAPSTFDPGPSGTVSAIGFGNSVYSDIEPNSPIGNYSPFGGYSFSLPRDGQITALSAYFTPIGIYQGLESPTTVTAQLYRLNESANFFEPIMGAKLDFALPANSVIDGMTFKGLAGGLSIPVLAQTRLLLIFSMVTSFPLSEVFLLRGDAGGGLSIN